MSRKKTWEELTPEEKIEDLRNDVIKIFDVLRRDDDRIASLGRSLAVVEDRLATRVLKVEEKLDALASKSKRTAK